MWAIALALGVAAPAWAEKDHEEGLFLRLAAGAGYGVASVDETEKFEMYGITREFQVALGGIIHRNVALHGTLWGWQPFHTEARFGGTSLGGAHDFELIALGPGATYWFGESNVYASFSFGMATLDAKVERPDGQILRDTARGFALDATVGHEWWKTDNLGVGFAADYTYLNIENSLPDAREVWTGGQSLRLSATWN